METKWKRQEQECSGTYMFSGKLYLSSRVNDEIPMEEIHWIVEDVLSFVKAEEGIDYIVSYVHQETGKKLFFIDQLNREMIASGNYESQYNHATLIFAEEY